MLKLTFIDYETYKGAKRNTKYISNYNYTSRLHRIYYYTMNGNGNLHDKGGKVRNCISSVLCCMSRSRELQSHQKMQLSLLLPSYVHNKPKAKISFSSIMSCVNAFKLQEFVEVTYKNPRIMS